MLDLQGWQARRSRFDALRDELLAAWSGAGRAYHTPRHLLAVLDAVQSGGHEPERAFVLAAWFHDAVYDARRSDNEEESARWLDRATAPLVADGELAAREVALARRMVRATARPLDPLPRSRGRQAVRCFLDADFEVFASLPEDYERYAAGVRQEYAFVPEAAFRAARLAFLEKLRAEVQRRGWFFRGASPLAEALARSNLAREIAGLREP
jgi:predicted metal-dependent HD superfamily phosphohydrolase